MIREFCFHPIDEWLHHLIDAGQSMILLVHASLEFRKSLRCLWICMYLCVALETQACTIGHIFTAASLLRNQMVIMLNGCLFTQKTDAVLHGKDSFFDGSISMQWSFLILPALDMRILHTLEIESIDLQGHIRNRKNLSDHFYTTHMSS